MSRRNTVKTSTPCGQRVLQGANRKAILRPSSMMNARAERLLYVIVPALLFAMSVAPIYGIACPIVCDMGAGSRPVAPMPMHQMPSCRSRHCPMCDSSRKGSSNDPRGGQGSNCASHYATFDFVIPAAVSVHPQVSAARSWMTRFARASVHGLSAIQSSPSPPGVFRGGRALDSASVLRI
jgi:hypothetical protein